ncbi:hypothetical protein [Halanaerobium hydrogeniformans]|uniref:Lipoprotein protein n=1 Tax=Halanaerobium hydrogeniformans TaxID=656519 RepID=E4RLJ1_HALHG|nr:hypothetical protein [Halanaerobium hydrogeniformans]ADQ14905.1 putative lipoprotein protein [Halanaerobium hydrogeniformans]
MLISLIIGGCVPDERETVNLKAYLPLQEGMTYNFTGEGPIHPGLEREIMFTENSYGQILDKGTGTNIVLVYKVEENRIVKIFAEAEFYDENNLIKKLEEEAEVQEVILQLPLEEGATWETNDKKRRIVSTDKVITVPAGTFYDVIQIKITSLNQENNNKSYHYYAKNIGLIKQKTIGENFEITLELEFYGL